MRKPASRLIIALLFFSFIACSKDNKTTNSASLSGNWTFQGFHAKTSSTAVVDDQGEIFKTITTSDYTTTANAGTVNISGNTMTGNQITYAADIGAFVTDYDNNVITDTFSTSFPITIPPTNSTSTFEVIGSDSIHYTGANMFGSGGNGAPASDGAKFSVSGDVLTLTSNVVQDKTIDTLGEVIQQHSAATVVATLKKQ
jgi:hypothetical protein